VPPTRTSVTESCSSAGRRVLEVATLTDTGPLVALIDAGERDHDKCKRALAHLETPMVTTWPVLTEAMYLLGDAGGWQAQRPLWAMIEREALTLADLRAAEIARARALMEKYRDAPMDIADATLVAVAEARGLKRVFTLDSDFGVYRLRGREAFELIPG
jgi:predicted nucleic acid-binding protein